MTKSYLIIFDQIIFVHKFCTSESDNGVLYFAASSHFHTRKSFHFYARSGRTSVSHYQHVLCVAPGNKHIQKPCINSTCTRE